MRHLYLLPFIFFSFRIYAQNKVKVDSIYYLLDTINTPVNDRMWNISHTDSYQLYILKCSCLNLGGNPVFSHEIRDKGKGINKSRFKTLKLTSITELITISKRFLDDGNLWGQYLFFFIEPKGNQYTIYQETLFNPDIKIVSGPDVFQVKSDTSAFARRGLITVKANDVKSHLNEEIITGGPCVDTKIDADGSVLLFVNGDNAYLGFIILIKKADLNKFDLPERHYYGKPIRVTGKIIEYKGERVVNINNENQILITTR